MVLTRLVKCFLEIRAGSVSKIVIIGSGTNFEMFREERTLARLRSCTNVFALFASELAPFLPEDIRGSLVALGDSYVPGKLRVEIYNYISDAVVDAASREDTVGYIALGSPVVFDAIVEFIRFKSWHKGISCEVYPAINSIDSVLAFLGESVEPGICIYEARWFVANEIVPERKSKIILVQPSVFTSDEVVTSSQLEAGSLQELSDYLCKFYDAEHKVVFVRCPCAEDAGYFRVDTVGQMGKATKLDLMGTSIFIPQEGDNFASARLWRRVPLFFGYHK